jgi:hypothetical protein
MKKRFPYKTKYEIDSNWKIKYDFNSKFSNIKKGMKNILIY